MATSGACNACTTDACKDKVCVQGAANACDDGNACTADIMSTWKAQNRPTRSLTSTV